MFRIISVALSLALMAGAAHAHQGKLRNMSPTERRLFIQNGGLAGKCKYERCYGRCMAKRGMDQFSNAKCAQRCANRGCV
jgi:hypothetical protein